MYVQILNDIKTCVSRSTTTTTPTRRPLHAINLLLNVMSYRYQLYVSFRGGDVVVVVVIVVVVVVVVVVVMVVVVVLIVAVIIVVVVVAVVGAKAKESGARDPQEPGSQFFIFVFV